MYDLKTSARQLAIPIDGIRSGILGNSPMDKSYMAGVRDRARMLAQAYSIKPHPPQPMDPILAEVLGKK